MWQAVPGRTRSMSLKAPIQNIPWLPAEANPDISWLKGGHSWRLQGLMWMAGWCSYYKRCYASVGESDPSHGRFSSIHPASVKPQSHLLHPFHPSQLHQASNPNCFFLSSQFPTNLFYLGVFSSLATWDSPAARSHRI